MFVLVFAYASESFSRLNLFSVTLNNLDSEKPIQWCAYTCMFDNVCKWTVDYHGMLGSHV